MRFFDRNLLASAVVLTLLSTVLFVALGFAQGQVGPGNVAKAGVHNERSATTKPPPPP